MILRFMGDLPEPVVNEPVEEEGPSLRKRIYNTLSRKSKSKLEKEVAMEFGGGGGEEEYDDDAQVWNTKEG